MTLGPLINNFGSGDKSLKIHNCRYFRIRYGPREVTRREDFSMKGQLMCELKFATFSCQKRRGHLADKRDSEYSLLLQNALEPAILLVRLQALISLGRKIVNKLQGLYALSSMYAAAVKQGFMQDHSFSSPNIFYYQFSNARTAFPKNYLPLSCSLGSGWPSVWHSVWSSCSAINYAQC